MGSWREDCENISIVESFTDLIRVWRVGRGYESLFESSYNHQTSPPTLTTHNWTQKHKAQILHLKPRTVSSVRQVKIVSLGQLTNKSLSFSLSRLLSDYGCSW